MAFSGFVSTIGNCLRNSVATHFPTRLALLLSIALFSSSVKAKVMTVVDPEPVAQTCEANTPPPVNYQQMMRNFYDDYVECIYEVRRDILQISRRKKGNRRWTQEDENRVTAQYGKLNACVFQAQQIAAQDPSLCFRPEDAVVAYAEIGKLRGEKLVGFSLYEKIELTADGRGTLRVPHLLVTMLVPLPDPSSPSGVRYVTLTYSISLANMVEDSGNPGSLRGPNYYYQGATNRGANSNAPFSVGLNRFVVPLVDQRIQLYSSGRRNAFDVVSSSVNLDVTRDGDDQWRAKYLPPWRELHKFDVKILNSDRLSYDQRSECLSTNNIMVFSGTYGAPGVRPNGLPQLNAMNSARVIADYLQSSASMDGQAQVLQGLSQMPITGLANAGLNTYEEPTAENAFALALQAAYNLALVGPGVSQGGAEIGALGLAALNAGMTGQVLYDSLVNGNDVNTIPLLLQSLNLLLVAASLPPSGPPQSQVWKDGFTRLNADLKAACNQCTQVGTQNAVNRAYAEFARTTGWNANMGKPLPYDPETLAVYAQNLQTLLARTPNLPVANVQPANVPLLTAP